MHFILILVSKAKFKTIISLRESAQVRFSEDDCCCRCCFRSSIAVLNGDMSNGLPASETNAATANVCIITW